MLRPAHHRTPARQGGQILVIFILGLTALVGTAGLVLDGGDTYAQRRAMQNAADLAATAGANAYLNTTASVATKTSTAIDAARAAATRNGYTNDVSGASVTVGTTLLSAGARMSVSISKAHANNFVRVFGMNSWNVSVSAGSLAGVTDTAGTAAPWTMSIQAFNTDGTPKYTSANPQWFGGTNNDYPTNALDVAWTDFQGADNVNSSEVARIIRAEDVVTATIFFERYIGQHNDGFHTDLFGEVDEYMSGHDVPVAVVGPGSPNCAAPTAQYTNGCFKGWVIFHVISASGGSDKGIRGYFTGNFVGSPLSIGECTAQLLAAGTCGVVTAHSPFLNYVVRLSD